MPGDTFTPVERKMLRVFSDGLRHTKGELFGCLNDDLARASAVWFHVSNLRRKLRPAGQDIVCELYKRRFYYRQVRLLSFDQNHAS
jgi:hypothetical protein